MDKYFLDKINKNTQIFKNYLYVKKNTKYINDKKVTYLFEKYFCLDDCFKFTNNTFNKCYTTNTILKPNLVIINFPIGGKTLVLNYDQAKKINLVEPHYNNNYKEDKISFKYYDTKLNIVLNGPDIIFCTLPIESVFMKNNDNEAVLLLDYF
jgi:hypothetical protein